MRDGRKRPGDQLGKGSSEQAASRAVEDPQASKLIRMGKSIGNDEIQQRLSKGNTSRDELLDFLCRRLNVMREAQVRELGFADEQRSAARAIADSHKSETKPDPTRFGEAARIYEEAAYQLCRGDLGRGAQLVERAIGAEQTAFEALPTKIVDIDDLEVEAARPEALGEVVGNQGCGECATPQDVDLARQIQNVTTAFEDPAVKRRIGDPWWTEEEEEEEEGAADGGGG